LENTKLAFLGAADEALKADLASFNKANQDIATENTKLKEKQAELEAITLSNSQLEEFVKKEAEKIATSMTRSETYLNKLDTNAATLIATLEKVDDAKDIERVYNTLTPDLQLIEQYLLIRDRTKAQQSLLKQQPNDNRLSSVAKDLYKTKIDQFKREKEVAAITKNIEQLIGGRRDEILKRNALAVIEFLSDSQQATDTKMQCEVANGLYASASSALITYSRSRAFSAAGTLLAATSGSFLEPGAIGSRTSAVDIPSASSSRSSGSRPGVSNTAPFNPALDPKKPSQFPESDYRGKRKPRADPFTENTEPPKKAKGAAGATPAK